MNETVTEELEAPETEVPLIEQEPGGPSYHTLLEVWSTVLANSDSWRDDRIIPQWVTKVVRNYVEVSIADCIKVHKLYYEIVDEMKEILRLEIAGDPECLTHLTPESDIAENLTHYKNILLLWQQAFMARELDWHPEIEDAGVILAALSEAHELFFGDRGLVQHLGHIGFADHFTEADREDVNTVLEEMKAGR